MAEDWALDVKKYVPNADDAIIAGIVRYCGIALQKKDSSLVAFSDKKETDRVRNNFLKKKLGLTQSDATLDKQIAAVGERMKADRTKNRVTVYYLLAEHYKKLELFRKATKTTKTAAGSKKAGAAVAAGAVAAGAAATGAKKPAATKKPAASKKTLAAGAAAVGAAALGTAGAAAAGAAGAAGAVASGAAGAAGAAVSGAADLAGKAGSAAVGAAGAAAGVAGAAVAGAGALAAGAAGAAVSGVTGAVSSLADLPDAPKGGLGWLWKLLILLGLIALAIWLFRACSPQGASTATTGADASASATAGADAGASAAASGDAAIPAGAGVTTATVDGKPQVKVFFDPGKAVVVPAFVPAADGLKAYLSSHAGSGLTVSGFTDATGNPARNAVLAKRRADAVKAGLISAGIADASIEMVKPADGTTGSGDNAAARRVEVNVK